MKIKISTFFLLFSSFALVAQTTSVLFLGNSYVAVNNLPQTFASLALSLGDTVFTDSNTPGGYTLNNHSVDAVSIAKINQQSWNYVVLQEQSQMPAFSPTQVATDTYPYATTLNNFILANDSCTETVFYMTWGRQNGDASNCAAYPPICTFEGMQQRLRESYLQMSTDNHATVSPCGIAWKHVRDNYPSIPLYQADESHPTIQGTYLNASVFYASLFHKTPVGALYLGGLSASEALILQSVGGATVLDSIALWQDAGDIPYAAFNYSPSGFTIQFNNNSMNASDYYWDFGDGSSDNTANPSHTFSTSAQFVISLTASDSCKSMIVYDTILVSSFTGVETNSLSNDLLIYPNPAAAKLCVERKGIKTIFIYNQVGQKVGEHEVEKTKAEIDIGNLPEGIYFLRAIDKQGIWQSTKIVIDRNKK